MKGFASAVIGLILLEIIGSNAQAAGRVSGLFTTLASWISAATDPSKPLIADHSKPKTSGSSLSDLVLGGITGIPLNAIGLSYKSPTSPNPSKVTTTTGLEV